MTKGKKSSVVDCAYFPFHSPDTLTFSYYKPKKYKIEWHNTLCHATERGVVTEQCSSEEVKKSEFLKSEKYVSESA